MSQNLWLGVAALVSIACLFWLVWDIRKQPLPHILVFAVFAIFFRFLLSAFHPYTFPPLAGPLSINALYSAFIIGLGFLLIDHRLQAAVPAAGVRPAGAHRHQRHLQRHAEGFDRFAAEMAVL